MSLFFFDELLSKCFFLIIFEAEGGYRRFSSTAVLAKFATLIKFILYICVANFANTADVIGNSIGDRAHIKRTDFGQTF